MVKNTIIAGIFILFIISIQGCSIQDSGESGRSDVIMEYIPIQCVDAPWEIWYSQGNIQFVEQPTQDELITAYYSQEYNIELDDIARLEFTGAVCNGCDICRESFSYVADVESEDVEQMQNLGWEIYPEQ